MKDAAYDGHKQSAWDKLSKSKLRSKGRITVNKIMDLWESHVDGTSLQGREWETCTSYYLNHQHIRIDTFNNDNLSRQLGYKRDSDFGTFTVNRISRAVETSLSRLLGSNPEIDFIPQNPSSESGRIAEALQQVITQYTWQDMKFVERLRDALLWNEVTGTGFIYYYWDVNRGKHVTHYELDETGQPIKVLKCMKCGAQYEPGEPYNPASFECPQCGGEVTEQENVLYEGRVGKLQCEALSPWDVALNLSATHLGQCDEMVIRREIPVHKAKALADPEWFSMEMFNELASADPDEEEGITTSNRMLHYGETSTASKPIKETVIIYEYLRAPRPGSVDEEQLAGSHTFICDRKLMREPEPWPYDWDTLPLTVVNAMLVPGRVHGKARIALALDAQDALNNYGARQQEVVAKNATSQLIANQTLGLDEESLYDGSDIIFVNSDGPARDVVGRVPEINLNRDAHQGASFALQALDNTLGNSSEAVSSATTGKAKLVQQADESAWQSDYKNRFLEFVRDNALMQANFLRQFMPVEETYNIIGEDRKSLAVTFLGADIPLELNVICTVGSFNNINPFASQQLVADLWTSGIPQAAEQGSKMANRILRGTEKNQLAYIGTGNGGHTERANVENQWFKAGMEPKPGLELTQIPTGEPAPMIAPPQFDPVTGAMVVQPQFGEIPTVMSLAVHPHEDDPAHLDEHLKIVSSEWYYQSPPQVQQAVDFHITLHQQKMSPPPPPQSGGQHGPGGPQSNPSNMPLPGGLGAKAPQNNERPIPPGAEEMVTDTM